MKLLFDNPLWCLVGTSSASSEFGFYDRIPVDTRDIVSSIVRGYFNEMLAFCIKGIYLFIDLIILSGKDIFTNGTDKMFGTCADEWTSFTWNVFLHISKCELVSNSINWIIEKELKT